MSTKSRISEKTGALLAAMSSESTAPATPIVPTESRQGKTGPGQMLMFTGLINEANAKVKNLEDKLLEFEGTGIARKLDPKLIRASHWANRNEASFSTPEFISLKSEIESAGGNVQPIKVRPISGVTGEYEIVFGHRRHRACLELGLDVLALIEELTDTALFAQMDRENRERADLRPYEQGVMYARALDDGLFPSMRKLAESVGIEPGTVSKAISIARLPVSVLSAFQSPLDIQFRWATELTAAIKKDPDVVLSRAKELSTLVPKLGAADVLKRLFGESIAAPTIEVKGAQGRIGKFAYDKKKKVARLELSGIDAVLFEKITNVISKLVA